VNLAFGDRVTVNGIAAEISRQLGQELDVVHAPARAGDVRDSRNDPALLMSLFPDSAAPVPFDDGIASVLAWMGPREPTRL
jgi:UDP-glucose 4-epimerase